MLRSAEYPEITLELFGWEGDIDLEGRSELLISGLFRLVGEAHPVEIPIEVVVVDGQWSIDGSFEVPYVLWGLTNPSRAFLRVAKEVEVTVSLVGSLVSTAPVRVPR